MIVNKKNLIENKDDLSEIKILSENSDETIIPT